MQQCCQDGCENPAAYRFYWPGRDEAVICEAHVGWLRRVAEAMSLTLVVRPIEKAQCEKECDQYQREYEQLTHRLADLDAALEAASTFLQDITGKLLSALGLSTSARPESCRAILQADVLQNIHALREANTRLRREMEWTAKQYEQAAQLLGEAASTLRSAQRKAPLGVAVLAGELAERIERHFRHDDFDLDDDAGDLERERLEQEADDRQREDLS